MSERRSHGELFELLPWYVNGTLEAEDRAEVEAALPTSPTLRAELALLRRLQSAVAAEPEPDAPPEAGVGWWQSWRRAWWVTPPRLRWVVCGQAAAVAAAVAWLVLPPPAPGDASFSTMTAAMPASDAARLHLVFEPATTERDLRELLLDAGLVLVDGPSATGVYVVESMTEASIAAGDLAARLQREASVRLAAPIR